MDNFQSLLIYSFMIITTVCAFYVAESIFNKKSVKTSSKYSLLFEKIICLTFAISIPVAVAGLRYGIGTDYFNYIIGFKKIAFGYTTRWDGLEWGYVLLNALLARMGLSAQSIMFATSFFVMVAISTALFKKRDSLSISFGIFVYLLLFYQSSFNAIRISMAISVFLYNIDNIEKRLLFRFLLFTIIAASFHISALVTLPIYWCFTLLKADKVTTKSIIILIGIGGLTIFIEPVLAWIISAINYSSVEYYRHYIGAPDRPVGIAIKRAVVYVPILLPGLFMYKRCLKQEKNFAIYYYLMIVGVLITVLSAFKVSYFDRISGYFTICAVIIIPVYMKVLSKSKNYIASIALVYYTILFWLYKYFIWGDHGTVPYQWVLTNL